MKKTLFIILDGAAEKGRSALSLAEKPNLDTLASNSFCGMWLGPVAPRDYNTKSLSEIATLELLGYSWKDSPGRGFLEALGIGLKPKKNAIYLRANFATVDKNRTVDRRAGRDETGLERLSKKLSMVIKGVHIKFYKGVGHRGVLALSGKNLSRNITDSDIGIKPQKIFPLNKSDIKARRTANVLNEFFKKSHEILSRHPINKKRKKPANFILLRGAGSFKRVEPFRKRYRLKACSVSNSGIIQGISRYLRIGVIPAGDYSDVEENLSEKTDIAINALERYDFVILHINGADVFAHDKDLKGKVKFIEKIDREVFSKITRLRHINIAVISDHETSSKSGEHMFGPVPFLFYDGEEELNDEKVDWRRSRRAGWSSSFGSINFFDEKNCSKGFVAANPMTKILHEIK